MSACSQNQAPIEDLGKKSYGRDNSSFNSSPGESYGHNYSGSKRAYNNNPATPVSAVGESDLPPVQANNNHVTEVSNNNSSYNNHISVSDTQSSSPFPPPSKPLEQPVVQPASQPPVNPAEPPAKIYDKDGITLIWPVTGGKVITHFKSSASDGINIAISDGEPIVAAASGTIVYSGNDLKDYGNMVILRHDNSWLTAYANASRITVKKGAYVKQGDIIAYVGSSGGVKTPQLHFSLRKGKAPVDPEQYLPKN